MGKRNSGFSRIARLGRRRGDNTELVKLSLVEQPKILGTLKSGVAHSKKRPAKAKSAKKTTPKTAVKAKPAKKASANLQPKKVTGKK
jgi:hypothetical protein